MSVCTGLRSGLDMTVSLRPPGNRLGSGAESILRAWRGRKPITVPGETYSEQLSVPNGGFGKSHSKRLPLMLIQVRLCGVLAGSAATVVGRAKVRSAQGPDKATPTVAARMTRQPTTH